MGARGDDNANIIASKAARGRERSDLCEGRAAGKAGALDVMPGPSSLARYSVARRPRKPRELARSSAAIVAD